MVIHIHAQERGRCRGEVHKREPQRVGNSGLCRGQSASPHCLPALLHHAIITCISLSPGSASELRNLCHLLTLQQQGLGTRASVLNVTGSHT